MKSYVKRGAAGSRLTRGFTLIELMIALAVVGLLAGIALPAYREHVQRGKVSDALGALSTLRVQLEQFYQDNRHYGSSATSCGVVPPASSHFTIACAWGASGTSQSFLATATGRASAGMEGFSFSINEAGERRTLQYAGQVQSAPCWKQRRSDTC